MKFLWKYLCDGGSFFWLPPPGSALNGYGAVDVRVREVLCLRGAGGLRNMGSAFEATNVLV